jgi:zinc/manganese transport system substrate-binding protein
MISPSHHSADHLSKARRQRSSSSIAAGRTWVRVVWGAVVLVAGVVSARADLEVVATTADLAALAEAVGGNRIKVTTLAKPTEDPHFVDPKPSYIVRLNRADLLIEGGAELEASWLTPLLHGARNGKILVSGEGRVRAAEGLELLNVPTALDRSAGDLHAAGNPHFLMDPFMARTVAEKICEAMARLDTGSADYIRANFSGFAGTLDERMAAWQKALEPHRGRRLVAYHNIWLYFGRRFGLRIDLFLEPKPGIPPTPASLNEVVTEMNRDNIRLILVEPFQPRRVAERVAERTNAEVIDLTQYPGGIKGTEAGYIALMDFLVKTLADALERTR